jgi:hypothetical protein
MTDQDKNQLLDGLFGDEDLARLRQASLQRGLQEMRGRRRRALAARVGVMAVPTLLLALLVYAPPFRPPHPSTTPAAITYSSRPEAKVEFITTDQLYALFPDRPMALLGKPGHQQVIFLDENLTARSQ